MNIVDCLIKTGFTKHESILYLALCKEGELTGYEAAKISGIPRSNAYLALAGLVDKGGAYRIDSDVIKYIAVPAKEFTANVREQLDQVLRYIESNIPEKDNIIDRYITIHGRLHIINKMKIIINQANERIYLSMSLDALKLIEEEIIAAKNRGLKVVIITSTPYELDNVIIYHTNKKAGQIRLITDTSYVLTGELYDDLETTCLYSQNKNLVQLIKDSLTNEINIIKIQNEKS